MFRKWTVLNQILLMQVVFVLVPVRAASGERPRGIMHDWVEQRLFCRQLFGLPDFGGPHVIDGKRIDDKEYLDDLNRQMQPFLRWYQEDARTPISEKALEIEQITPSILDEKRIAELNNLDRHAKTITHEVYWEDDMTAPLKEGPVLMSFRHYPNRHGVGTIRSSYSSQSSTSDLYSMGMERMESVLRKVYARDYSPEEIHRVMWVEKVLDPGRKVQVMYNRILQDHYRDRGETVSVARLYDASAEYTGATKEVSFRKVWKKRLENPMLPMEVAHPGLKINAVTKLEIGRFGKIRNVENTWPLMKNLAGIIKELYAGPDGKIPPDKFIFITAKEAQIEVYRDPRFYGLNFRKPPRERLPLTMKEVDPKSDEEVYEITAQEYVDRFSQDRSLDADAYPWLIRED